jgi:hypothetical protein
MEPLATTDTLDFSAPHVIAIVLVACLIGLTGVGLRRFLMAYADELHDLWRQYGPIAIRRLLEQRSMPASPWFCDRCRSRNSLSASRCYACGALRAEAVAPVPNADTPAGASAGRAQRNRR